MAAKQRPESASPEKKPVKQADPIDEASEASFPASDPPSWTPTQGAGPPARSKDENAPDREKSSEAGRKSQRV